MNKILKRFKQLLPPVMTGFIMKNLGYLGLSPWEYIPEGFSYSTKLGGWNLNEIAELQGRKWQDYKDYIQSGAALGINHESSDQNRVDPFFHNLLCSFAYVLTLASLKKDEVKFLDWGGGIGHYGLLAQELLKPANLSLSYYNYDFDVFEEYGKPYNPNYMYFNNESQYTDVRFDLVMASSSIWYEHNWKEGVDKLCKYDSDFLYITRMIFIIEKPSYVAIQRPKYMGYKTEYLFWVINKTEFTSYLKEKGFDMIREFEFGEVSPIFKAPEQGTMKGFLFKRISM